MANIILTNSIRSSLLSLQNTSDLLETTQNRLSTGLKVSSALDDAAAFFTAKGLSDRATDFLSIKSSIEQGISSLKNASSGIEGITKLVDQLKGIVNSARQTADTSELNRLVTQYNSLLTQVDQLASDSTYNGTNLIQGTPDDLTVVFNENNSSNITISGIGSDSSGLSLSTITITDLTTNIDALSTTVDNAKRTLRTTASTIGSNSALLTTRLEFTREHVSALKEGAGNLTIADKNEEAANLLTLQTQQQLSTNALSLASQSEQSILRLLNG